jgi:hypothetical protein
VTDIRDLRGRFPDLGAIILANGPSLDIQETRVCRRAGRGDVLTFGLNRSWMLHPADFHVLAEQDQLREAPRYFDYIAKKGRLIAACDTPNGWPEGTLVIPEYRASYDTWSWDLTQGVVSSVGGVGSVAYVALQLAVWMGCRPVYWYGLDLSDTKFEGSPARADRQVPMFDKAAKILGDYPVYVVGSPKSNCRAWPHLERV